MLQLSFLHGVSDYVVVKIDGRFNSRSMIIRNFDHPAFSVRYINSDSAVSGEVGPQEDMASSAPEHSIHSVLPLRFVFACYRCRYGFVDIVVVIFFVL